MKNALVKILLVTVGLTAGSATLVRAQQTLQVVTRTVEKTFAWRPGETIQIDGEKATIELRAIPGNQIRVVTQLTAKHRDRATAEREQSFWQFVGEKQGKTIFLRNYIALPKSTEKPAGNLLARYEIGVPAACAVVIRNRFGPVTVANLAGRLTFKGEFSALSVEGATGALSIQSDYGDITLRRTAAPATITVNRANVTLDHCRGTAEVTARYNRVAVVGSPEGLNLRLRCENTEVDLPASPGRGSRYDLRVRQGDLRLPPGHRFNVSQQGGLKRAVLEGDGSQAFRLDVEANYGTVAVQ